MSKAAAKIHFQQVPVATVKKLATFEKVGNEEIHLAATEVQPQAAAKLSCRSSSRVEERKEK